MNNNNILCDHSECPLKENCARYLEGFDRKTTYHVDPMPYKNGRCFLFVELTQDDIIQRITNLISAKHN